MAPVWGNRGPRRLISLPKPRQVSNVGTAGAGKPSSMLPDTGPRRVCKPQLLRAETALQSRASIAFQKPPNGDPHRPPKCLSVPANRGGLGKVARSQRRARPGLNCQLSEISGSPPPARPRCRGSRCHHGRLAARVTGAEPQGWGHRLTFISSVSFYSFSTQFIGKHSPAAPAHPRPLGSARHGSPRLRILGFPEPDSGACGQTFPWSVRVLADATDIAEGRGNGWDFRQARCSYQTWLLSSWRGFIFTVFITPSEGFSLTARSVKAKNYRALARPLPEGREGRVSSRVSLRRRPLPQPQASSWLLTPTGFFRAAAETELEVGPAVEGKLGAVGFRESGIQTGLPTYQPCRPERVAPSGTPVPRPIAPNGVRGALSPQDRPRIRALCRHKPHLGGTRLGGARHPGPPSCWLWPLCTPSRLSPPGARLVGGPGQLRIPHRRTPCLAPAAAAGRQGGPGAGAAVLLAQAVPAPPGEALLSTRESPPHGSPPPTECHRSQGTLTRRPIYRAHRWQPAAEEDVQGQASGRHPPFFPRTSPPQEEGGVGDELRLGLGTQVPGFMAPPTRGSAGR